MKFTVTLYEVGGGTQKWQNVDDYEFVNSEEGVDVGAEDLPAAGERVLYIVPKHLTAVLVAGEPEESES